MVLTTYILLYFLCHVAMASGGVVLNIRLINITIVNQTSVQTINIRFFHENSTIKETGNVKLNHTEPKFGDQVGVLSNPVKINFTSVVHENLKMRIKFDGYSEENVIRLLNTKETSYGFRSVQSLNLHGNRIFFETWLDCDQIPGEEQTYKLCYQNRTIKCVTGLTCGDADMTSVGKLERNTQYTVSEETMSAYTAPSVNTPQHHTSAIQKSNWPFSRSSQTPFSTKTKASDGFKNTQTTATSGGVTDNYKTKIRESITMATVRSLPTEYNGFFPALKDTSKRNFTERIKETWSNITGLTTDKVNVTSFLTECLKNRTSQSVFLISIYENGTRINLTEKQIEDLTDKLFGQYNLTTVEVRNSTCTYYETSEIKPTTYKKSSFPLILLILIIFACAVFLIIVIAAIIYCSKFRRDRKNKRQMPQALVRVFHHGSSRARDTPRFPRNTHHVSVFAWPDPESTTFKQGKLLQPNSMISAEDLVETGLDEDHETHAENTDLDNPVVVNEVQSNGSVSEGAIHEQKDKDNVVVTEKVITEDKEEKTEVVQKEKKTSNTQQRPPSPTCSIPSISDDGLDD